MKYGIWRHENALGNSAEHTVGLWKHINRTGDKDPIVFVENEFQKDYALCIPGITSDRVKFFDDITGNKMKYATDEWGGYDNPDLSDIYMPGAYPFSKTYDSQWKYLGLPPHDPLKFPDSTYENKHNLPANAIVISIREKGTFWKRVDGDSAEEVRFVDLNTFFDVALHYADLGHKVVRIGDKKQTPMPSHENILDFALVNDRRMLDDLFLINHSKLFISCDSGVWPMAGGFRVKLLLTNIAKEGYTEWLPEDTTAKMFKDGYGDNTLDDIIHAADFMLEL